MSRPDGASTAPAGLWIRFGVGTGHQKPLPTEVERSLVGLREGCNSLCMSNLAGFDITDGLYVSDNFNK